MSLADEIYVNEILTAVRKAKLKTVSDFLLFTRLDVAGGYKAEVDEALRRFRETLK